MATTTTYAAIRDNIIARIIALVPATLADKRWDRAPRNRYLAEFAKASGSGCFRAFEIMRTGVAVEPPFTDPSAIERNEEATLTVAYPVLVGLYGLNDMDDMEALIRADQRQLRDVIYSPGGYLAGQSCAYPVIQPIDKADPAIWFAALRIELIYTEAQSLT